MKLKFNRTTCYGYESGSGRVVLTKDRPRRRADHGEEDVPPCRALRREIPPPPSGAPQHATRARTEPLGTGAHTRPHEEKGRSAGIDFTGGAAC
jgi:hypothetical protein